MGRPVFITPAKPREPSPSAPIHAGPALHDERTPGDALRALPATYRRCGPEKTALHALVRGHLETLLAQARQASADGSGYPAFVEKEFCRYLDCGILANGFARLRCPTCGFERFVVFSCKGRLCPSCWAKRAADSAAHRVDRVLPEATYRQWVLTFPWEARLFIAIDRQLLSDLLRDFLRTVFAWQRRPERRAGLTDAHCGAVTFVQIRRRAEHQSPLSRTGPRRLVHAGCV